MPQRNDRKVFFIRSSFVRLAHRLTVLFILWSSCSARIKFCYDTEKEGYRLNTTAHREVHALSGADCAVHCVHDHCCRSVNYRKDPVYDGKENCELLITVASEEPENLKPNQTYDYYVLLEPERSFNCHCSGCENGGTCQGRPNCSCLAGFSGKRCEKVIAKGNITGHVTFDNYGVIKADGVTVKEKRTHWNESISFTLPANTTLVVFEGENEAGSPGGVVASFSNGVVTDESWECTDGASVNSTAWPMAVTYGRNIKAPHPWNRVIQLISGNAQWIWTKNSRAVGVDCRKSFAIAQGDITGHVTFDNYGVIKADGVTVKEKTNRWEDSISFTLPANTTLVIFEGRNGANSPGGVVASFSNGVVTDESWECTDRTDSAPVDSIAWPMAVTYGRNSWAPHPWKRVIQQISASAQWIWTDDDHAVIVHCRKSFDMDECITSPCYQDTICYNTLGSYKCTCRHGEMVNGIKCEDSLYSSKILGGDGKYLKQLYQWLNNEIKWKLCYRASDHGWGGRDFHSNCDGKGDTVTIVRVGDYIFGGYSDVDWGGLNGPKKSSKAFLFSFRNKDNLPPFKSPVRSTNTTQAIIIKERCGPTFGEWTSGGHDLHISHNIHTSTTSHSNLGNTYQLPPGYSYGTAETQQLLAGSHTFLTSEIEVYYMY